MKNKILKRFIIIAIAASAIFGIIYLNYDYTEKISKNALLVTKIAAAKMQKKYNVYLSGFGGGGLDPIRMRAMSLTSLDGPYDIKKARKLIVYCTEMFLKEINSNKKIRKYLCKYPFPVENVEVRIFLHYKDNSFAIPPDLACVRALKGKVIYSIDKNPKIERVKEETYEEALKILKKQK